MFKLYSTGCISWKEKGKRKTCVVDKALINGNAMIISLNDHFYNCYRKRHKFK